MAARRLQLLLRPNPEAPAAPTVQHRRASPHSPLSSLVLSADAPRGAWRGRRSRPLPTPERAGRRSSRLESLEPPTQPPHNTPPPPAKRSSPVVICHISAIRSHSPSRRRSPLGLIHGLSSSRSPRRISVSRRLVCGGRRNSQQGTHNPRHTASRRETDGTLATRATRAA